METYGINKIPHSGHPNWEGGYYRNVDNIDNKIRQFPGIVRSEIIASALDKK